MRVTSLANGTRAEALQRVGHASAHWRPAEEQNAHKLTLGVKEGAPAAALASHIRDAAAAAGLRAKVVASGTGGWRYVDVVSSQAGKLESLEYVRNMLRFELHATLAAGDSGNDILMLSGRNRAVVVGNAQPDLAAWAAAQLACGDEAAPDVSAHVFAAQEESANDNGHHDGNGNGNGNGDGAHAHAAALVVDVEVMAVSDAEAAPQQAKTATQTLEAPVAPAAAEPQAQAQALAIAQPQRGDGSAAKRRLYVARACQAWGVIEGLQHFGCA